MAGAACRDWQNAAIQLNWARRVRAGCWGGELVVLVGGGNVMGHEMTAVLARELLARREVLFSTRHDRLVSPLVYINEAKHTRLDELHEILPLYLAGTEHKDEVVFGSYAGPVFVDTRQSFLASCGETLICEQVPHYLHDRHLDLSEAAQKLERGRAQAMTIDAPVLLIGRFGYEVWGHWLNEMLPKALAVEAAFPGRFSYALPAEITIPTPERSYSTAVRESLAACGIGPERLIRLPPGHVFKLTEAYDVAGIWQFGLHPGVLALMRAITAGIEGGDHKVLAMRHPNDIRAIYNGPEIAQLLVGEGFTLIDQRRLEFKQQAALYAGAAMVAGELGSNLSGLIFAPPGVRLLSFAPFGWLDAYFIYMMKERAGYVADVRGATTHLRGADPHRSPFVIDPQDVRAGLTALMTANRGVMSAGGQIFPRAVGEEVLRLGFGAGGNGISCLRSKFHPAEALHSWSKEDLAVIEIAGSELLVGDYYLEIRGFSVSVRDFMPARSLGVRVNGQELVRTHVTGNARVMMRVPASVLAVCAGVRIEIDYPVIGAAHFLGATGDMRKLGIGLKEIVVYRVN